MAMTYIKNATQDYVGGPSDDLTAAFSRVPTSQITSTTGSAKTLGQLIATGLILFSLSITRG